MNLDPGNRPTWGNILVNGECCAVGARASPDGRME